MIKFFSLPYAAEAACIPKHAREGLKNSFAFDSFGAVAKPWIEAAWAGARSLVVCGVPNMAGSGDGAALKDALHKAQIKLKPDGLLTFRVKLYNGTVDRTSSWSNPLVAVVDVPFWQLFEEPGDNPDTVRSVGTAIKGVRSNLARTIAGALNMYESEYGRHGIYEIRRRSDRAWSMNAGLPQQIDIDADGEGAEDSDAKDDNVRKLAIPPRVSGAFYMRFPQYAPDASGTWRVLERPEYERPVVIKQKKPKKKAKQCAK